MVVIFVCSKSEYTLKSASVSGRLHDNLWKSHPIVMKFSIELYLINISPEFEDENDSSRNDWVIAKNVIISAYFMDMPANIFFKTKTTKLNFWYVIQLLILEKLVRKYREKNRYLRDDPKSQMQISLDTQKKVERVVH